MGAIHGSGKCRSCSNKGQKRSEETCNKLSIRMKKLWSNSEFKNRLLEIRKHQWTDEVKNKILSGMSLIRKLRTAERLGEVCGTHKTSELEANQREHNNAN